jgi:hypothetical protein
MAAHVVSFFLVARVGTRRLTSPQRKFILACLDGDVDRIKGKILPSNGVSFGLGFSRGGLRVGFECAESVCPFRCALVRAH